MPLRFISDHSSAFPAAPGDEAFADRQLADAYSEAIVGIDLEGGRLVSLGGGRSRFPEKRRARVCT